MKAERGFTLLELIVAAGILALIAVFSWRGLDALVREREALAASQAPIDLMQRSFARLERDALLAGDVEVDDERLRLVAGTSSVDGANAATVEYRLVAGTLTRSVPGVDRAPLAMIAGVASLAMEAWAPTPRGGSWVRLRAQAPGAAVPPPPTGANAASPAGAGTPPVATVPQPAAATAAPPAADAATGIRLTIALADGSKIVRAFMVGGG